MYRSYAADRTMLRDVLTVEGDAQSGEPLVTQVMAAGKRTGAAEPVDVVRARVRREIGRLPAHLRALEDTDTPMRVEIAPALRALADAVDRVAR